MSENFRLTIDDLKKYAQAANFEITDKDISSTLKISLDDFISYYEKKSAPAEIFTSLRGHYGKFIRNTYTSIILHDEVEDTFNGEDDEES